MLANCIDFIVIIVFLLRILLPQFTSSFYYLGVSNELPGIKQNNNVTYFYMIVFKLDLKWLIKMHVTAKINKNKIS